MRSLTLFFISVFVFSFFTVPAYAAPGGVTTDLELWLKADAGTNVNGSQNFINGAGAWVDQSGNGRSIDTVSSDPQLLSTGLNFNPAVQWDGNDYMVITTAPQNTFYNSFTQGEVFTVLQENGITGSHGMPYFFGGPATSLYTHSDTRIYDSFGTSERKAWDPDNVAGGALEGGGTVTGPNVNVAQFNIYNTYSALNDWVAFLNGMTAYTDTVSAINFTGTNVYIGARPSAVFNGITSEHILYDRKLTATERLQVNSYLATKYGITLGTTTNPVSYLASDGSTTFWTGDATYQNNIAGIGRDDTGELDQRQSLSSEIDERDGMVTIGLGTIASDNASNPNSFAADLSFLMWGDNGADPHFVTSITSPGNIANTRLTRVWNVQETGTVGTVKVGVPNSTGFGNTVYLVVSADDTFDNTDTFIQMDPLTVGSTDYLAADHNFTDGEFFTFATTLAAPGNVSSDLELWLKADDGLSVDGSNNAIHWTDRSDNDHDADIITSDPQRLDGALNFNPVVRFDGNDYFRFNSSPFVTSFTEGEAFAVLKDNIYTACACGHLFDFGGSNRSFHYTWNNGAIYEGFGTNERLGWVPITGGIVDGKTGVASITGPLIDPRVFHLYNPYSETGNWGVFFDGTQVATTATNTTNFTLTANNEEIGATGANIFNGDGSEVLLFDRVLTSEERARVNSYLALKYGITLDQTSGGQDYIASDDLTEMWDKDAPDASTYDNNIAGIGRDDTSLLNQKQSRTINTADKAGFVTMGLGTIASDNSSNANSFASNLSFLTWGDNGESAEFELPITVPGGVNANYHTARIWKVQETGTVGTVKLGVPENINAFGNTIYLVVSSDATFDNTDQFVELTPFTVGSTNYLAADFDFTDGEFFAFASYVTPPGGVAEGLEYWIKPEDMQLTDSNVTNWDDVLQLHTDEQMVSGGFLFSSSGFNFHPTATTNGDRYMRFLSQQLLSGATAGEVFYALESTGAHNQNDGYPSEFGGSGSAQTWEYDFSDSNLYSGWGSTVRKNWNPLTAPAGGPARDVLDPHIYNVLSAPGEWTARFDGVTNFTTATNSVNFNTSTSGHTYIGASSSSIFKGKLSEVLVYRRALSAAERLQVNSYLSTKYGMTLGTNTAPSDYMASNGTTTYWMGSTTYQNNIQELDVMMSLCLTKDSRKVPIPVTFSQWVLEPLP